MLVKANWELVESLDIDSDWDKSGASMDNSGGAKSRGVRGAKCGDAKSGGASGGRPCDGDGGACTNCRFRMIPNQRKRNRNKRKILTTLLY
jgi:hypothetical protein